MGRIIYDMEKFGERVSERMSDLQYDAKEIAGKLSVTLSTVYDWKRGKYLIGLNHFIRLADILECSLDFLAGRSDTVLDFTPKPCPPFYDRLRALMKERGITRYRIVKETRLSDTSFTEWKAGKEPHLLSLILLADTLDCSIDYLVGRER